MCPSTRTRTTGTARSVNKRLLWAALASWCACGPPSGPADAGVEGPGVGPPVDGGVDGIVFVHGINSSAAGWDVMKARFLADGWPADRLVALTFDDPSWGCNVDNAARLGEWVTALEGRGARHVAVVAHSMGGLASRSYLKDLGGTAHVSVMVSLGSMHHGLVTSCLALLPLCTWVELCSSGPFIEHLNSPSAVPGPTRWVSIFSDSDHTVPAESSKLGGATNIELHGLTHDGPNGLQDSALVYQHVRKALLQ